MEFVKTFKIYKNNLIKKINKETDKLRKEDESFNSYIEKIEEIHFEKSLLFIEKFVFYLVGAESKGKELKELLSQYINLRNEIKHLNEGLTKEIKYIQFYIKFDIKLLIGVSKGGDISKYEISIV